MTCDETEMNISMYVDDALDVHLQEHMFAHLAACTDCRTFMRRMLDLRARLAAIPPPEVPQSLDRRVMNVNLRKRRGSGGIGERVRMLWSHRLSVPLPSVALAALALITITVLSISLLQSPEVVSVPCLPAVDVYAGQPANPVKGN